MSKLIETTRGDVVMSLDTKCVHASTLLPPSSLAHTSPRTGAELKEYQRLWIEKVRHGPSLLVHSAVHLFHE